MAAEEAGMKIYNTAADLDEWHKVAAVIESIDTESQKPEQEQPPKTREEMFKELVEMNMLAELLSECEKLTRMISNPVTRCMRTKGTTSCRHLVILTILSQRAHNLWKQLQHPAYPTERKILSVLWRTILIDESKRYPRLYNFFMMNNANDYWDDNCHFVTSLTDTGYSYYQTKDERTPRLNIWKDTMFPCTMALVKVRSENDESILHVSHYFSIIKQSKRKRGYSAYGSEYLQASPFLFQYTDLMKFVQSINETPEDIDKISDLFNKCFANEAGNFQYRDDGLGQQYRKQYVVGTQAIKEGIEKEIDTYKPTPDSLPRFLLACFPTVSTELVEASLELFPEILTREAILRVQGRFSGGRVKKRRFKSKRNHMYRKIKSRTNKRKSHKHKHYKN